MSADGPSATIDSATWSMARLVLLDIDAHLATTDQRIAADTVGALELVRAAGHTVLLSTGRSLVGLLRLAGRLGLNEGYAICSHGALTVRLDPGMPSGYEVIDAVTFDLAALILQLEDLRLLAQTRIAAEEAGAGWRVNHRFETGLRGFQEQVPLARLRGEATTQARLHAAGISQYTDILAAATGLTVTPTGPDSCDVTGPDTSLAAACDVARDRLGLPAHTTTAVRDSLHDSVNVLIPPDALRPGLSALAAQLTAAVTTAATTGGSEAEVAVRVWLGDDVHLSRAELWSRRRHGWVRSAPIPAGRGATMRDVEHAALDAGLPFPRGTEGRRRPWWRSIADDRAPAGFELPLGRT
ncbi:HAD hydrolase family protein [Myceligenerans salitolerans]|uniref:HAD hydrolase family protein n=1 Tax=Myceligenerans salitolerans TaxID=1230528 RepID=A0ABS3ICG5_9MICO|nr:HAD hydrolase family protein [Myceligenerans salitolerans]MBO0610706.1 HAD hydrolase family protein [Myceligenerans salitolerans]